MELSVLTVLLIALAGILVGVLSAMFGIGGGTVMVPLLHIAFGLPAASASGTSLFAILPTSISAVIARLHDGTIRFKVGLIIGVAGAAFSPVGAWVSDVVPGIYAMVLTALIILFNAYKMFKKVYDTRPAPAPATASLAAASGPAAVPAAGEPAEPTAAAAAAAAAARPRSAERGAVLDYETAPLSRLVLTCVTAGIFVGFLSGYLGLGGGFVIVPLLQWGMGFSMKQATGTSLVGVAVFSVPAFITHTLLGHIAWVQGLLLILGALVGTRLGAGILRRVNDRMLTGLFGIVLVLTGIVMIVLEFID